MKLPRSRPPHHHHREPETRPRLRRRRRIADRAHALTLKEATTRPCSMSAPDAYGGAGAHRRVRTALQGDANYSRRCLTAKPSKTRSGPIKRLFRGWRISGHLAFYPDKVRTRRFP